MLYCLLTGEENATVDMLKTFFKRSNVDHQNTKNRNLESQDKEPYTISHSIPTQQPTNPSDTANTTLLKANLSPVPIAAVWQNGDLICSQGNISQSVLAYSMGKSFAALVFGRLKQLGKVDYNSIIPRADGATYAQFMSMSSSYQLNGRPGESHAYNNKAVQYYANYMKRTFFRGRSEIGTLRSAYADAIGLEDDICYTGWWSGWGGGFSMSARDYGKIGHLVLNRGQCNGRQIISAEFIDSLYSPKPLGEPNYDQGPNDQLNQHASTQQLRNNYSYGWWIVATDEGNAIAAQGFKGKNIIVLPSKNLVIVGLEDRHKAWEPIAYLNAVLPAIS